MMNIKKIQDDLGLSQSELMIKMVGYYDASTWMKWVTGKRPIPMPGQRILSDLANDVPEWTYTGEIDGNRVWLDHNTYPLMRFRIISRASWDVISPWPDKFTDEQVFDMMEDVVSIISKCPEEIEFIVGGNGNG